MILRYNSSTSYLSVYHNFALLESIYIPINYDPGVSSGIELGQSFRYADTIQGHNIDLFSLYQGILTDGEIANILTYS